MDCQPLVPSSSTDTVQTFEGKLNGKIDGLFAKLAGGSGDAEGKYNVIKQDTLKDYPNASDTYIWNRFIYLRCEQLADSKESDDKKFDQLDNLIKLYQAGPPKAK